LLSFIQSLLADLDRFREKEQTRAEVETFILDYAYTKLPSPPFTDDEIQDAAGLVYQHVWQQGMNAEYDARP
jgi:type I restriction enzyme R subunit